MSLKAGGLRDAGGCLDMRADLARTRWAVASISTKSFDARDRGLSSIGGGSHAGRVAAMRVILSASWSATHSRPSVDLLFRAKNLSVEAVR